MYLDLSPRQRFVAPQTVQRAPLNTPHSSVRRRVALYGLAFLIAGSLIVWSTGKVAAISSTATAEQSRLSLTLERDLLAALAASDASAFDLANKGFGYLEHDDQVASASLFLQAASAKDPKYRDAALYAGFAELKRADALWASDPTTAARLTRNARTFLELARSVDPIHAYTYELLEVAYTNLGQAELAADAKTKAASFAK